MVKMGETTFFWWYIKLKSTKYWPSNEILTFQQKLNKHFTPRTYSESWCKRVSLETLSVFYRKVWVPGKKHSCKYWKGSLHLSIAISKNTGNPGLAGSWFNLLMVQKRWQGFNETFYVQLLAPFSWQELNDFSITMHLDPEMMEQRCKILTQLHLLLCNNVPTYSETWAVHQCPRSSKYKINEN